MTFSLAGRGRPFLVVVVALVLVLGLLPVAVAGPARADASAFTAVTPARLADTRDATGVRAGALAAGQVLQVPVGGRFNVPADAYAAALNVTVTGTAGTGYVTAFPCGQPRPLASNLNFVAGQTVPNAVLSRLGAGGAVCFYVSAATHLLVDVNGWYPAVSGFKAMTPVRLADTRDGTGVRAGVLRAGQVLQVPVGGRFDVPVFARGTALNVTVTGASRSGFVTAFPCGSPRPLASNLNFEPGQTVPNLVLTKLGAVGVVCLYSSATVHVIVDETGWFEPRGQFLQETPVRLADTRDGTGVRAGVLTAGQVLQVPVGGRFSVSAWAGSASLNVTVTGPAGPGYATVFPCGQARPLASNLNFSAGQTVANAVLAKLGTGGAVCIYASATTHIIVDVNGWYMPGALDTVAPGPVTGLSVRPGSPTSLALAWTNPADSDLAEVVVRRNAGSVAPTSPTAGTAVVLATPTATSVVDVGLMPGSIYAYAVFTRDSAGNTSAVPATAIGRTASAPVPLQPRSITAGGAHTCALDTTGKAWCWGSDDSGQLGDGGSQADEPKVAPVPVAGDRTFMTITAGDSHTCALDTAGTAWCWGWDRAGQLGDGGTEADGPALSPVPVAGDRTFVAIDAGALHTCALDQTGRAYCWGYDEDGQVGDGDANQGLTNCILGDSGPATCVFSPEPVAGGRSYVSVSAGDSVTCALDAAKSAWCWGSDWAGQVGDGGTSQDQYAPAAVDGGRTYRSISAGGAAACALDTTGRAWCWGWDANGAVGDGEADQEEVFSPVAVAGNRSYSDLAAGGGHVCALDTGGGAWCWGEDFWGQLGDGGASRDSLGEGDEPKHSPVAVAGARTFAALAGGDAHACALDGTGKAWCWGANDTDQLGNSGVLWKAFTPLAVEGSQTWLRL